MQVLFVTVDPGARHAGAACRSTCRRSIRASSACCGDADATARTAKEFKVLYQKQPGTTPDSYTMDHSAGTFIFDPQGRLRLYVGHGQGADVFAHDLRELLRAG